MENCARLDLMNAGDTCKCSSNTSPVNKHEGKCGSRTIHCDNGIMEKWKGYGVGEAGFYCRPESFDCERLPWCDHLTSQQLTEPNAPSVCLGTCVSQTCKTKDNNKDSLQKMNAVCSNECGWHISGGTTLCLNTAQANHTTNA